MTAKILRITGCNLCEARRLDAKKRAEKGLFVPEVECMCCGYWQRSIKGARPTDGVSPDKIIYDEIRELEK